MSNQENTTEDIKVDRHRERMAVGSESLNPMEEKFSEKTKPNLEK